MALFLGRLSSDEQNDLRKKLHESQGGNCFICGKPIDLVLHAAAIDVDHIEPTSAGGKDSPENFALTHDRCNRSKQASDLRVARVLARFSSLADQSAQDDRSFNLGDLLAHYGGGKHDLAVTLSGESLKTSYPLVGSHEIECFPIYTDKISGFRSSFINLPIEYLHHDDHINPRAIGVNLRKLVVEFYKGLPQLHISLGWIDTTQGDHVKVKLFDGQHKAAAQILLGARTLPVRVFVDPDTDVLLTANTNAGTTLRQVAFDKSVQRSLGSSILSNRIDRYREERRLNPDDESFSEQDLVNHFKGERRQMQRYVLDRVRDSITMDPKNKLRDYIEYGGRSTGRPLSYSAIERTFYQFFIYPRMLPTPFNYKFEDGANPRQLEIDQIVRLMNMVADEIYLGQFDPNRGTRRIEIDVQKGSDIAEDHLRAFRMSKEEILHNWVRLSRSVVLQYFLNTGRPVTDDNRVFQREVPEVCWGNIRNFIGALKRLPLWVNKDLSLSLFGTKRNNDYWAEIFDSGDTPEGARVMPSGGLDLLEMIRGDE
ncbi:MAG: HNH endonuclease signature motif containing protein [Chloroflexi bacterium]|nr:HNH endonuclease signature motif containing protein [Chloroflexota bacterium]